MKSKNIKKGCGITSIILILFIVGFFWMFKQAFGPTYKTVEIEKPLGKLICKALNKKSPINLIYEMFLDHNGEKISKSKGNGISVEEWLRYSSPESLSLFMFQKPKSAKKLFFDVIPKSVDDYFSHLKKYHQQK